MDVPDDIVIVAIDESSIGELGRWPWSRAHHAELLEQLADARAVFFDIVFSEAQRPSGAEGGESNPDAQFAAALSRHGSVVLPVQMDQYYAGGPFRELLPLPAFAEAAAAMGHVQLDTDSDGISRQFFLREGVGKPFWPHAMIALASIVEPLPKLFDVSPNSLPVSSSPYERQRWQSLKPRFLGAAGSVATVTYSDVLRGAITPEQWRGKIVLVGATAHGIGDYVPTPVGLLPGVELQATILQAIRASAMIVSPKLLIQAFAAAVLTFVGALLLSRLAPSRFLLGSLLLVALSMLVSILLFAVRYVWVSPLPIMAAVALFYPLWSWRRIEIALDFLRDELTQLRRRAGVDEYGIEQLRAQLESLVELQMLEGWSLKPVAQRKVDEWPSFLLLNRALLVYFRCSGSNWELRFRTDLSEQSVAELLHSLLPMLREEALQQIDSYELVEKTIAEIYLARADAEHIQSRLNNSLAQLQDAVVITDLAGRVLFENRKSASLFGRPLMSDNILTLSDRLSGSDWRRLLFSLLAEKNDIYQELDIANTEIKILCQAAMISGDPSIVVFVFTDVSQLRSLERSKNEALAFLSHDMRSPIVSLLSLIESFRQHSGDNMGVEATQMIEKVEYFARRNLKYSEGFLQLARAENINEDVFQLVDMHGVVDGAVAETYGLARRHGVRVGIVRPDHDCWVNGDSQLLERSVANLLNNAITHTERGKSVRLVLAMTTDDVLVKVIDEGCGIEPELIAHLFEPYFRARNRAHTKPASDTKSFGLGLSFVDIVARRHGGIVGVESSPGHGTTLCMQLPLAKIE